MSVGTKDLKPKHMTENEKAQRDFKGDIATVVREDGKEFQIDPSQIRHHLDRGFELKKAKTTKKK